MLGAMAYKAAITEPTVWQVAFEAEGEGFFSTDAADSSIALCAAVVMRRQQKMKKMCRAMPTGTLREVVRSRRGRDLRGAPGVAQLGRPMASSRGFASLRLHDTESTRSPWITEDFARVVPHR